MFPFCGANSMFDELLYLILGANSRVTVYNTSWSYKWSLHTAHFCLLGAGKTTDKFISYLKHVREKCRNNGENV